MNNSEFEKVMRDIQLLKYKINNTLLMCNVIKDDLETILAINDMDNDRTCTTATSATDDWVAMCTDNGRRNRI